MWKRKAGWIGIEMVTFLLLISMGTVLSGEYRIDVKDKVVVARGMCVIIPCQFTADGRQEFLNAKGLWMQGWNVVASSDKSTGWKKNFHVVGDPNKGNCTLKITDAQKQDADYYSFRFEQSGESISNYNYFDTYVKVEVADIKEFSGYAIEVAQEVFVKKGHCVTIPCSFTTNHMRSSSNSKGYWRTLCQETVASNIKSITPIKKNFELKGNPDQGDCTLMITNAQEEDAGQYYFRYEDREDKIRFNYFIKLVTIQVRATGEEKPKISDPGILTEGKEATITCTAPGGCPNSQYTWGNSSELWAKTSKLTFIPTRNHHQMTLTCNTSFPFARHEINVSVHYSPSITITTEMADMKNTSNYKVAVKEGDTLELKCLVDSNPRAEVTWMKGNETTAIKQLGSELRLYLPNITSSENGTYYCLASNNINTTSQVIHIIVETFPDSIWPHFIFIYGIAAGGSLFLLVLIGLGIFFLLKQRNKRHSGNSGLGLELKKTKDTKESAKIEEDPDSNIYVNM